MNFWASLEYEPCSVIGVVGAKYRNHYAQIVMVGISAISDEHRPLVYNGSQCRFLSYVIMYSKWVLLNKIINIKK